MKQPGKKAINRVKYIISYREGNRGKKDLFIMWKYVPGCVCRIAYYLKARNLIKETNVFNKKVIYSSSV